jgi:methylase of polypeptide subunit release factors
MTNEVSHYTGEEHYFEHLNHSQKEIVFTQLEKHQHEDHEVDYDVSGDGDVLNGFLVKKGVWSPFLSSGRYHARYLFYNNHLFYGKTAIEIGSGSGLMSIVMAKYGAKKVIASDISEESVVNTRENIRRFGLEDIAAVVQGDLFENVNETADLITWMIPFFPEYGAIGLRSLQDMQNTILSSMLMSPELFKRFLHQAKPYLNEEGVMLLPSYSLGGKLTNPALIGRKMGYYVRTTWIHNSINGIQRGLLYIHELRLNNNPLQQFFINKKENNSNPEQVLHMSGWSGGGGG